MMGVGLFLRRLINLGNVDTGFNRENVLRLQTDASSVDYKDNDPRLARLYQQIEERISALPGVRAASYSLFTYNEGSWNNSVWVQGYDVPKDNNVKHNVVATGYFSTMGISLLEGRTFGP